MAKAIWKDYFSFSKKERIAIVILLFIIGVFIILPFFFSPHFKKPIVDTLSQHQVLALQNVTQGDTIPDNADAHKKSLAAGTDKKAIDKAHLFYFDPNTLDSAGWQKIGLRNKTIQTIINYRNKGGRFKQPEDLRKIYGLQKEEADLLIPFVQIKSVNDVKQQTEQNSGKNKQPAVVAENQKKIDINTATAEEFKSLPGIGDILSNRIVKFRNAIHGFKSIEDIRKTYGLSDSGYQLILPYLTINNSLPEKN
jgi:competence protein ComEA